ncbi:hypothetical protein NURINAE_01648 [Candidatus Nitrosacidococcus sp. I8]|nr:hypothetical protein NURINAE_01648 [Candidatus Nitrosacidococcus sp. I8]
MIGGGTGFGISDHIKDGYRFIVSNYHPGDEIFVFGFSRGAYSARSLVGLINKMGILKRANLNLVDEVYKHYEDPFYRQKTMEQEKNTSDGKNKGQFLFLQIIAQGSKYLDQIEPRSYVKIQKFRNKYNHRVHNVYPEDSAEYHKIQKTEEFQKKIDQAKAETNSADRYELYKIDRAEKVQFLGVFDTVSALGLPTSILSFFVRKFFKTGFHDVYVSNIVQGTYHALAADENRFIFRPTLFRSKNRNIYDDFYFDQKWFTGIHSNVGGGYREDGMSNVSLEWMAEKAEKNHKLHLDLNRIPKSQYNSSINSTFSDLKNELSLGYRIGFVLFIKLLTFLFDFVPYEFKMEHLNYHLSKFRESDVSDSDASGFNSYRKIYQDAFLAKHKHEYQAAEFEEQYKGIYNDLKGIKKQIYELNADNTDKDNFEKDYQNTIKNAVSLFRDITKQDPISEEDARSLLTYMMEGLLFKETKEEYIKEFEGAFFAECKKKYIEGYNIKEYNKKNYALEKNWREDNKKWQLEYKKLLSNLSWTGNYRRPISHNELTSVHISYFLKIMQDSRYRKRKESTFKKIKNY